MILYEIMFWGQNRENSLKKKEEKRKILYFLYQINNNNKRKNENLYKNSDPSVHFIHYVG